VFGCNEVVKCMEIFLDRGEVEGVGNGWVTPLCYGLAEMRFFNVCKYFRSGGLSL
jgi:hypothetical protein